MYWAKEVMTRKDVVDEKMRLGEEGLKDDFDPQIKRVSTTLVAE